MPLIIALRRQAPQWRRRDHDFLSGDDHRSMGASPIVAEPRLDNTQATGHQGVRADNSTAQNLHHQGLPTTLDF